jgi:hypothetical protein
MKLFWKILFSRGIFGDPPVLPGDIISTQMIPGRGAGEIRMQGGVRKVYFGRGSEILALIVFPEEVDNGYRCHCMLQAEDG